MSVDVDLLGAVALRRAGVAQTLRRGKERALLARLALAAPKPISIGTLVADLWPDDAPARPIDTLRVHVANLRRALGSPQQPGRELLQTVDRGYRLAVPPAAVDVHRFEHAVAAADQTTSPLDRAQALQIALMLWSDWAEALNDVDLPFAEVERVRLDELRALAWERYIEAELATGQSGRLVGRLEMLTRRYPSREAFWLQLMTAQYRAGREGDALAVYHRCRAYLAELGLQPGPRLRGLENAIHRHSLAPGPVLAAENRAPAARYAEVEGARVAYQVFGTGGTDLLLLHGGFIPCVAMWDAPPLASFLRRLGEQFRVLLCDRRGTAMSDPPGPAEALGYGHWVTDCLAVLDAACSREVIVFGHEHAGPAVVRLADARPDRVTGIALHTVLSGPDPDGAALVRTERMIDAGSDAEIDLLAVTAPSAGFLPGLRDWLERAGQLGASPGRAKELHRLYRCEDIRPLLPRMTMPALVLHAARNRIYDVAHAHALGSHLPCAEVVVLDSADHLFWLHDADRVLGELVRLADRASARARQRTVLAAVVALLSVEPATVAAQLRSAGAWAVRTEGPDLVLAAFSSIRHAATAAADACGPDGRGSIGVADIDPALAGPLPERQIADARSTPPGTVTLSHTAQVVDGALVQST